MDRSLHDVDGLHSASRAPSSPMYWWRPECPWSSEQAIKSPCVRFTTIDAQNCFCGRKFGTIASRAALTLIRPRNPGESGDVGRMHLPSHFVRNGPTLNFDDGNC
jgi:hypothetical protein